MRLTNLALLALSMVEIVNSQTYTHFDCGTDQSDATAHFMETVKNMHQQTKSKSGRHRTAMRGSLARRDIITVPTYFHIVTSAAKKSQITSQMAGRQIQVMNSAYKLAGVYFNLLGTDYTVNDTWAVGAGGNDTIMKAALRKGTYNTLNIYFQSDLTGNILGKCTLPTSLGSKPNPPPSVYVIDGCNIQANTMPGGTIRGYNEGMTAVHETGHWMGLLHVFEGYTCGGDGDFIADTPTQMSATDGCPTSPGKDSCPLLPGNDSIHNYMDYSTDACYTGFTALQIARMASLWATYRLGN